MRVNIYAEELTSNVELVEKSVEGVKFRGIRFYLHLPATVDGKQYKGPFMHRPDDDDGSAVTFWSTKMSDLQDLFASALKAIDEGQLGNPKV
jgi:hypothetical protein